MNPLVILGPDADWRHTTDVEKSEVFLLAPDGFYRLVNEHHLRFARPVTRLDLERLLAGHTRCGIGKGAVHLATLVPWHFLEEAAVLFTHLAQHQQCEGVLLLYYAPTAKKYELVQPKIVSCSHGHVKHEIPPTPTNWWRIGCFHSHPHEAPHQSTTDLEHDLKNPGLHVIVGDAATSTPSLQCFFTAADGHKFPIHPRDLFAPPERTAPRPEWVRAYTVKKGHLT